MAGEPAGELEFALEPAHGPLVDPVHGQDFQRHDPVEALLVGAVNDGETVLAGLIEYPVAGRVLDWQHSTPPCHRRV
jgi:hypothetical protein